MFTPEELFWSHHQAQLAAAGYGPQVIYSDLYAQQAQQVQPAQQAQHFMFEQRAMQSYAADSQEVWPEDPHGDTEWYGEGNTTWRGANASGRASGSKGRGRGRGAKAWEHENYTYDGHGHWEQTGQNGNWDNPKAKKGRDKKGKWRGSKGAEEETTAAGPAHAAGSPKQQSFYEKPKGKKSDTHGSGGRAESDLVATTESIVAEETPEKTNRAWRSKRVENKQKAEKEKETGEGAEKPKAKEKSGGWGDGLTREVRISKTLTQILRHKAVELEVGIRPDGFCPLRKVLECSWLSELDVKQSDVEQVVKRSDKKRFELKEEDGEVMIRAVQGHSIKVIDDDQLLKKLDLTNLPELCVHGTYRKHFESIKQNGLLAGGGQGQGFRNHVHFSAFAPGDKRVISGMRYDCEVAIWIDLKKAIEDEVPFYMSANQVILSPGINGVIDKKYFTKARDLHKKEDLSLEPPLQ